MIKTNIYIYLYNIYEELIDQKSYALFVCYFFYIITFLQKNCFNPQMNNKLFIYIKYI